MKRINKRVCFVSALLTCALTLSACGGAKPRYAYGVDMQGSPFNLNSELHEASYLEPFAVSLCVTDGNVANEKVLADEGVEAEGLFDLNAREALYARNVFGTVYPASITKVMTALVALKYGSTDKMMTASANVKITETGAQLAGIKEGDQMTMDQALHLLLLYSANDAAIMIAEDVGGSVAGFCEMMNEEAKRIGATGTNFTNPNGLTEEAHYTTAYDLYLIFAEAVKYERFNEIISLTSYATTYHDAAGREKEIKFNTTNGYISGTYAQPAGITVLGGKTGTTNAAGHCLILYSKDTSGNPYISVVMSADSTDELYRDMTNLLEAVY